ncbi:MAG TPA: SDR family oxidoreductase [Acetobacteraceae bacterium]|nr:SDR family oxidoreductase [Acetobacteraceae bacterium]
MVTGAGSGLGRATALALAARGCALALVDIDATATEAVSAECGAAASVILQDLTAECGPEAAVDRAVALLGGLDIVVNNAGYGEGQDFFAMRGATWDRTLDLNLKAVALICAAAGRHMRVQRSGRIVNVTSPASRMALPNYLAYAASKAGVDAVTRGAAVALAPFGVTVNAVAPGMMDTPMQRITEQQLAALEGRNDFEVFLAERTRRIPLGRRTDCATVAATVVWLALDAPDYITAERLNASGGLDKD